MKILIILLLFFLSYEKNIGLNEQLPSIEAICYDIEIEIRDLELMKNNLKNEFKKKGDELEQFELLPELTKDINNTLMQQVEKAKLYHYLECSKLKK